MISTGFGRPLVEHHESIDVRDLARRQVLVPWDSTVLQHGRNFAVTWTPCNYGGARPWFLCPGCQRRAALLYAPDLLCRKCYGLAYQSQHEDAFGRAWLRVARLRERLHALGIDPERPLRWPPPRGMRNKRYARLLDHYNDVERRARGASSGAVEALAASHQRWEEEHERRLELFKKKRGAAPERHSRHERVA